MNEVFAAFAKLVGRDFAEKFDKDILESEDTMIILYVEEDAGRALKRIKELYYTFAAPKVIQKKGGRKLVTSTGLEFMAITPKEIDRIRGLNLAAVFINCYVTAEIQLKLAYQVRPQ